MGEIFSWMSEWEVAEHIDLEQAISNANAKKCKCEAMLILSNANAMQC